MVEIKSYMFLPVREQTSSWCKITRNLLTLAKRERRMEIVSNAINATRPDTIIAWQAINWRHAKCQVRKIQERIVKAVQNN